MTWVLSLVVAAVSGVAGLLLAGVVASLAVDWYSISSFEGGAGYLVVGIALVGGLAGAVIGLAWARSVAAGAGPGFLGTLGRSFGTLVTIAGVIGVAARLNADVPPEVDGSGLLLSVEIRWPAADQADPAADTGTAWVQLGSASGGTVRKHEDGPLFVDLVRRDGSHWVVPGAARIFTTRGKRVLSVMRGDQQLAGFLLPAEGNSNYPKQEWSEWLPRARPGAPSLPDQFSYRYRVVRASEPVRSDSVGAFTIATVAGRFDRNAAGQVAASSTFRIAHDGQPLAEYQEVGSVSVIREAPGALLVQAQVDGEGQCVLLTDEGRAPASRPIGSCYGAIAGQSLTADPDRHRDARARHVLGGWVDRETFATPGLYLVNNTVLDTRTLAVHPLADDGDPGRPDGAPAVSLSPNERSFVWFSWDASHDPAVVGVTDWKADTSYTLPVDPTRMRFRDRDDVDPAWIAHHFAWVRGRDGVDRLQERERFTPLPYRGSFVPGRGTGVTMYSLSSGGMALRQALAEVLIAQLGAARQPDELDGFYLVLTIGGKTIKATTGGGAVSFSMLQGEGDPVLMTRVAAVLDAALATGKYDALFVPDKR